MDQGTKGIIFSIVVHAAIIWTLIHANLSPMTPQNETTEIVILEKESTTKKSQTFVTDPDNKPTPDDLLEKLKSQADYLSQFTKRVKKEIIAANKGKSQNAQTPTPPKKGDPEGIAGMQTRGQGDGFLSPGGERDLEPIKNVAIGQSAISEHVPGVEEGAFTALNTDQFTYYAFFARMNEQVRNRWVAIVREYLDQVTHEQMTLLASRNRQTTIEIILSTGGEFLNSIIHKSSGDKNLDHATSASFQRAAPFLNPPKGMVEGDGKIHLRYTFFLRFRPPGFGPEQ